ncbi:MAG TPA: hypothetical protein VF132_03440 [Rudaea sp.]
MNILKGAAGAAMLAAVVLGHAQNLVQNPRFDVNVSDWQTSIGASWSNGQDHSDPVNGLGGALQVSTSTSDFAQQCVPVNANTRYIADVWIRKDPNPQFAQCSNPRYYVASLFYSDGACQALIGGSFATPQTFPSTQWFDHLNQLDSPANASTFKVLVGASCGASNGSVTVFFDDVSLIVDDIFSDTFEQGGQ